MTFLHRNTIVLECTQHYIDIYAHDDLIEREIRLYRVIFNENENTLTLREPAKPGYTLTFLDKKWRMTKDKEL